MTTISTRPASIAQWDDVQHALSGGGDGRSCQCVWPVLRNKDWNATTLGERQAMLHDEIAAGPPPGLIAYVDGEAAGWVRVGPRPSQQRIVHTRAIAAATDIPMDDEGVWAITCFVVRKDHRGIGLTAALLDAAVEYARDAGARTLEAYPVDTSHGAHRSNDLFHGTVSTFAEAGFEQGEAVGTRRILMTRGLDA